MCFIPYSVLRCVGRSNLVVRALVDFVIGLLIRFSTFIFTNKYVTLLKSLVWAKDPLATKLRLNYCRRAVCYRPYLIANFIISFCKKNSFQIVNVVCIKNSTLQVLCPCVKGQKDNNMHTPWHTRYSAYLPIFFILL